MPPFLLAASTWKDVGKAPFDVAVLPWGATEAHNYHLPYGTDTIQAERIAALAAGRAQEKGAQVVVLPAIPFGVNTTQLDIKLCNNMNPSTQPAVLADIVGSLEPHGIAKLVILNGHGGNDFKQIIRELTPRTKMFLSVVNWYSCVNVRDFFQDLGDHAGEAETSAMLHLVPELVRPLSEAGDGRAKPWAIQALREGWAWAPRRWTEVSADTGIGDPRGATAEKGAAYVAAAVERIAEYLVGLSKTKTDALYAP
jgi:creatinine amidohydrolase